MGGSDAPPTPDYASANREAIQTDISTLPTRRLIEQAASLGQLVNYTDPVTGEQRTADFRGLGDAAAAEQLGKINSEYNAATQRQQLALRQELGVANAEQTAKEIQATDPLAYETRQNLTGKILGDLNTAPEKVNANESIYDAATRLGAIDPTTGTLNESLKQAFADYNTAGFSDATQRELNNQIRSGQAARGNFLGDAAAVAEASQQGQAMEALRAQKLGQLLSVQQQAFGQNQAQNQAALQGATAAAAETRQTDNTNYGREQQTLANASAMVLGQPITNQFGALQGAQQGAVGMVAAPPSGYSSLNPNAGAQGAAFAQQNYQTESAGASQGNPWMPVAGAAAGAAVTGGLIIF